MTRIVSVRRAARRGFSLIEMLVATALTLIMVGVVVQVFATISDQVTETRSMAELSGRLKGAEMRLLGDLKGVTAKMAPPLDPESGQGYFEAIEGAGGPVVPLFMVAMRDENGDGLPDDVNNDGVYDDLDADTSVGDMDDRILFTTRSQDAPFSGRFGGNSFTSNLAEVAWFVRGRTLYRRVLLIAPRRGLTAAAATSPGFYGNFDLSVRQEGGAYDTVDPAQPTPVLVQNSLGDLTKRENRYAHQPWWYPHDGRFWGQLGLPTLRECSSPLFPLPLHNDDGSGNLLPSGYIATAGPVVSIFPTRVPIDPVTRDFWNAPQSFTYNAGGPPPNPAAVEMITGTNLDYLHSPRLAEDVMLTDVLSFDVKLWDPGAPIFPSYDAGGNRIGAIQQGDPAYVALLGQFMNAPANNAVQPMGYGSYVDLNYMCLTGAEPTDPNNGYEAALQAMENNLSVPIGTTFPRPVFAGAGDARSQQRGRAPTNLATVTGNGPSELDWFNASLYDTWSSSYERDGINQGDYTGNPLVDEAADNYDNNDFGGIDDVTELEAPPPYAERLRGIKVTIRVYERDTHQVREVSLIQDFIVE